MTMTTPPPEYSPIRGPLFQRWMRVWHTIYISGLLVVLGLSLWGARGAWGWQQALLIAIVAVLIAAYARLLIFYTRWPHPNWLLALYFIFVLVLLSVASWIDPIFIWLMGWLFGQMFSILPPVLILPGLAAVLGAIILAANEWRLPDEFGWQDGLLIGAQVLGMFLLYLYIYHAFRTSQERAGLVNELRAATEQLERARDAEAELATLRERERVARDLHDGLGHSLVALSVQLEAVQRLYPVDPARASAQIDEMKRLTRDSMAQLRAALDGLRAPERADEPLSAAIQRLGVGLAERSGLAVTCDMDAAADTLRPAAAAALWRIAQEALTNVERHAGATVVNVRLALLPPDAPARAVLTVTDNGRGLPPDAANRPGHYGLRGMRERVEGLGGTLTLANHDGACLTAEIPLV